MYSLTLWIGIPGERRIWLEQWQGIPLILKNLSLYFPSIKVYVDGMTAYDGERIEVTNNLEAFWKIVENTKEVFEVDSTMESLKQSNIMDLRSAGKFANANVRHDSTKAESRNDAVVECKDAPYSSLRGTNEVSKANASPYSSLRGTNEVRDEAIHNQAYFKDSIAESKIDNIIDCHDSTNAESRNDTQLPRHCEDDRTKQSIISQKADSTMESRKDDPKNTATIVGAKGEIITLKSLSGYDYRTKICYCSMCEIAISEISTTALTPFNFCKKRGVGFYSAVNEYQVKGYETKGRYFINTRYLITHQKGFATADFHIPPEHLYNLAAESLEELSLEGKIKGYSKENPLKMHRLPVPPVELYAKLYELEKKTQVALKGNKAELEILGKIESQRKLLEAQNLLLDSANRSETTPSTPKPQGAKERIHNHLAYKLGLALIVCSKSLWGYIRMPYVLSHIKAQHRFEQEKYQRAITRNPNLKLPKLESYADYQDALKEKQCYTYKLGLALMEADKTWLKGGYLWFYLESKRLKREFEKERR